jgi:hypothetical protein
MSIKFNTVTWYSKLFSILFFIAVLPILTFYIGTQYQLTVSYQNGQPVSLVPIVKKEKVEPKIDIGTSELSGDVSGKVTEVYERDGKLWVNIDPSDSISTLACVFRAYDAGLSRDCQAPNGLVGWDLSTSTIAMPLSEKATLAVYYNDGTKINLKPKVINETNGKLYSFSLTSTPALLVSSSSTSSPALSLSDVAKMYNRILSFDGDDTYRWNPPMYISVRAIQSTGTTSQSGASSEVVSIKEVWRP